MLTLYKVIIGPISIYSCETCAITKVEINSLEIFRTIIQHKYLTLFISESMIEINNGEKMAVHLIDDIKS